MKKYIYFLLLSLLFVPTVVHGAEYVNDNQAGATGSISFYGETEEVDKEKDINRIKLPQTGENTSHITMVIGLIIVINSYYYLYIKKEKRKI